MSATRAGTPRRIGVLRWVLPVLCGLVAGISTVGLSATAGVLISRAALRPDNFLSLSILTTAVRGFGVARAGGRYAERVSGHVAALGLAVQLRLELFDRVTTLPDGTPRLGELLGRQDTDIDATVMYVLRVVIPAVTTALVTGGFAAWAGRLNPLLLLAVLVPAVAFGALVATTSRRGARLADEERAATTAHTSRLLDALAATADGAERLLRTPLGGDAERLHSARTGQARLDRTVAVGRELLLLVSVIALSASGTHLVHDGRVGAPVVVGVTLGTITLFEVLGVLGGVPAALAQYRESARRARQFAALSPAFESPAEPVGLPAGPTAVDLREAEVRYGERRVLRDVNLIVAPGDRVVVQGPSGQGKTTLLRVLARRIPLTGGELRYNGVGAREVEPSEVHRRLALAAQDAPLLDASIEENLRLGAHHATAADLTTVLREVGIEHPLSYEVGEAGSRLSGGERARIGLARALLSPADVLLLDEPTAHLDPETEAQVLDVIDRRADRRSLVIVTHRTAPVRLAGRVYRVGGGRLQEVTPAP